MAICLALVPAHNNVQWERTCTAPGGETPGGYGGMGNEDVKWGLFTTRAEWDQCPGPGGAKFIPWA